ncbi:MAG TPA: choice-of-anchor D domain-containing protein, partial [Baekduia sp.]
MNAPSLRRALTAAAVAVTAALLPAAGAGAAVPAPVTEFPLASSSNPYGITVGPDGNLWFASGSYHIGQITPGGAVTQFALPPGAINAYGITAGPDGALWSATQTSNRIERITTSGVITEFPVPTLGAATLDITSGPDGALWFTEAYGNKIGRITTAGVITEFSLPASSSPWGITAGPDGNLWFAEEGTNQIGRITTSGVVTEFALPSSGAYPKDITAGPDGNLWFTEPETHKIGSITPSGVITEYDVPSGGYPRDIATVGDDLWFTDDDAPRVGRITTSGVVTEFTGPSSATAAIVAGPDDAVWYTTWGGNAVGRIPLGADGDLSTSALDSGTSGVDGHVDHTVTLTNNGVSDLDVSNIVATGGFSIGDATTCTDTTVLASGDSCDVTVRFAPATEGAKTGTLSIVDGDGTSYDVALTGTATAIAATAATGAASAVGQDAAALAGLAEPGGGATDVWFEYGTTTDYGTATTHQPLAAAAGSTAVTEQLTGLQPSTTYHFRLVAQNDAGTTHGADATFTTGDAPVPPGNNDNNGADTPAAAIASTPTTTTTPVTPPARLAAPTLTTRPPALTRSHDVAIAFTVPASGAQCRLDAGPWIPCASPYRLNGVAAGDHVLSVRSVDAAGN